MRICLVEGCNRDVREVSRCHSHYEHWRRNGIDRAAFPETYEERFWQKVESREPGQCWLWTAATDGAGRYGAVYRDGVVVRAHRVAYELLVGPIPEGLQIDHLCRVTLCVNPEHLEPVTIRENIMRGNAPTALNAVKTHCKRGHEFTVENTRVMSTGGRACLTCEIEYHYPRSLARRQARRKNTLDNV